MKKSLMKKNSGLLNRSQDNVTATSWTQKSGHKKLDKAISWTKQFAGQGNFYNFGASVQMAMSRVVASQS
jgi:hypothetical protein